MEPRYIYIFLDESGDFNFSPKGSKYFIISSVTKERPFEAFKALHDLRYDLIERGVEIPEYFHATEDKQHIRDAVFNIIKSHIAGVRIDALIVEKSKTGPALRALEAFYPRMLGYLLKYIMRGHEHIKNAHYVIVPAALYTGTQKRAVEKAIKLTLAYMVPDGCNYSIVYQSAKTNFDVQIADYCTWAIHKKWVSHEMRPYAMIEGAVRSEFDIFHGGKIHYY